MANRFTDTEKWKDPWFCGLTEKEKLFWMYLVDNCDHAGIWRVNWPLVNFYIQDFKYRSESFQERIIEISAEKFFIKKFVLFQQKINDLSELNPTVNQHKGITSILEKEGLMKCSGTLHEGFGKGVGKSKSKGNKDRGVGEGEKVDQNKALPHLNGKDAAEVYEYYKDKIKPGGKEDAIKSILRLFKNGATITDLKGRIDSYKAQLTKDRKEDKTFYIQANNFFGRSSRYKDFEPVAAAVLKPASPDCHICGGTGFVFQQATSNTVICQCRKVK